MALDHETEQPASPGRSDVHVTVDGAAKRFETQNGSIEALSPVRMEIRRGEFFAIVGPSGCGKSTLLELLAGLQAPSSGQIYFEGQPIAGQVPDGIGIVFQEDSTMPWLSVRDNISFGLRMTSSLGSREIDSRVGDIVDFMGLRDFIDAYPAQLSGGMRQRVCIARTLVLRPRFILLDEPFGALDQQTRLIMGDELLNLWRETGATVLLITHALDEAAMLADRIGVMSARPGRFIQFIETGWPRERNSEIVSDPGFGALTATLWKSLRKESLSAVRGTVV